MAIVYNDKQKQLATSTTDAIVAPNQVAFSLHPKLFEGGRSPIVSVAGLAGVETVSFYVRVGATWKVLADSAGTAQVFSVGREADTFNSPGVFGYIKDATVSAIFLYVNDSR